MTTQAVYKKTGKQGKLIVEKHRGQKSMQNLMAEITDRE